MNESITRAAGGVHGQELDASRLQALAASIGRPTRERTTLYGSPGHTANAARGHRRCCDWVIKPPREQFGPNQLLDLRDARGRTAVSTPSLSAIISKAGATRTAMRHFPWHGWRRSGRGHRGSSSARACLSPTFRYHSVHRRTGFRHTRCHVSGTNHSGVGTGESLNEVPALGIPWPEPKERTARFKEAVALIRQLWREDRVSFQGQYYRTENATIYDKPRFRPLSISRVEARSWPSMPDSSATASSARAARPETLYEQTLLPNVAAGVQASGRKPEDVDMMIEVKVSFDTDGSGRWRTPVSGPRWPCPRKRRGYPRPRGDGAARGPACPWSAQRSVGSSRATLTSMWRRSAGM